MENTVYVNARCNHWIVAILVFFCIPVYANSNRSTEKGMPVKQQRQSNLLAAPPTLSYTSPHTYTRGTTITPLSPTSSGVAGFAYSNTPVTLGSNFLKLNSIAVDPSGKVYVADHDNIVKRLVTGGGFETLSDHYTGLINLAVDAESFVYAADNGYNNLEKVIGPGVPSKVLAFNSGGWGGVAVGSFGDVYFAEKGNHDIKKYSVNGGAITLLGSGFNGPEGVAIDAAGNVYVADKGNNAIKKIPAAGGGIITLGSGFKAPTGVAIDGAGNVFVADQGNNAIKEIPANGGAVITLGSGFKSPAAVAVDNKGNIYVADAGNNAVKIIKPVGGYFLSTQLPTGLNFNQSTGVISGTPSIISSATTYTVTAYNTAGSKSASLIIGVGPLPTVTYGGGTQTYTLGKAIKPLSPTSTAVAAVSSRTIQLPANFVFPNTVAKDSLGNTYSVDFDNSIVIKTPPGGQPFTYALTSGPPVSVTADANGNLYVGIFYGPVEIIPVGGGPHNFIFAQLPGSIAVDPYGNLFVCEGHSPDDPTGGRLIEIPAGTKDRLPIGWNIISPVKVAIDIAGNLYEVSGYAGHISKKIMPTGGYYISRKLPAGLNFDNKTGIISGTPTETSPATLYTITAYNSFGSASAKITLAVQGSPEVSYQSPQSFYINKAITAVSPANKGVASLGFSATPVTMGSGFNAPKGVAADTAGNLYVADFGNNTVKKIPAAGGNPVNISSGFSQPSGVAVDAAGNVYVADAGHNAVKKIPAAGGNAVTLGSGFKVPAAVAVDAAGNVYVADQGNNAIKKIPAGGGNPVTIGSGFKAPTGVAVDAAGNIYIADNGNNAVKKISAGSNSPALFGSGFNHPMGVATDNVGNVYIGDSGNNLVKKFGADGGSFNTVGSGFKGPNGIAIDAAGNIYVADAGNNAVKNIKPTGGYFISRSLPAGLIFNRSTGSISGTPITASPTINYVVTAYNTIGSTKTTLSLNIIDPSKSISLTYNSPQTYTARKTITPLVPASSGVAAADLNSNPVKISSGFNTPTGVAVDAAGNIYVSDNGNKAVKKIPVGGGTPVILASGFNSVSGIAVDVKGNVFVAVDDGGDNVVKKIPPGGGAVTFGFGFGKATGVAVDTIGNVYVSDPNNSSVNILPSTGGEASRIAYVINPAGIAVDAAGNLFIADKGTNAILKKPAGRDSLILITAVNSPSGVAVDPAGNLFVTNVNGEVKEISAGTNNAVTVGSGFSNPNGIAVDGVGNLYVADSGNNAVKEISPIGGYYLSKTLPAGLNFSNKTGTISGTPVIGSPATNYTITAYNNVGNKTATVNIKVLNPITLSYASPQTYIGGKAIAPLLPASTGVAIPAYNRAPVTFASGYSKASGLATDAAGNLYVADPTAKTISRIPAGGGSPVIIETGFAAFDVDLDGKGNVYGFDGAIVKKFPVGGGAGITLGSNFNSPIGIAVDTAGNVFVVEQGSIVYKIPSGGGNKVVFTNLSFAPTCVAIDHVGNLYLGSFLAGGIIKIGPDGTDKGAFAIIGVTADNITTDAAGDIFVLSEGSPDGGVSGGFEEIFPDGSNLVITANFLVGSLAVDGRGNLFVASTNIKKLIPAGGYFISTGLPRGLNFDVRTGIISGTPTSPSAATDYTVTAYNESGNKSTGLNITVLSSNATLASLTISAGTLNPVFASGTTNYVATVSNATIAIKVTPTASNPTAVIKVNGTIVASGTASQALPLIVGNNSIKTVVTAQSGATKTYTVNVTRAASSTILADNVTHADNLSLRALMLYPNPNPGGMLNIALKNYGKQENVTIYLYSMTGSKIKTLNVQTDTDGNYNTTMPLVSLGSPKFYIIRAVSGSGVKEGKVMVQ